jgi:hypothetical protein
MEDADLDVVKLGYEVVDYLMDTESDEDYVLKRDGLPYVSFFPAGVSPEANVEDPFRTHQSFVDALISGLGYEITSYLGADNAELIGKSSLGQDKKIARTVGKARAAQETGDTAEESPDETTQDIEGGGEDENTEQVNESVSKMVERIIREELERIKR